MLSEVLATADRRVVAEYDSGMLAQHRGMPYSNRLHTVERLTLGSDGDPIEPTIVSEDPFYHTAPITDTCTFKATD